MARLSVGSKFRTNFATSNPLKFEVLEITSVNGVPTDSVVVVFKKKGLKNETN